MAHAWGIASQAWAALGLAVCVLFVPQAAGEHRFEASGGTWGADAIYFSWASRADLTWVEQIDGWADGTKNATYGYWLLAGDAQEGPAEQWAVVSGVRKPWSPESMLEFETQDALVSQTGMSVAWEPPLRRNMCVKGAAWAMDARGAVSAATVDAEPVHAWNAPWLWEELGPCSERETALGDCPHVVDAPVYCTPSFQAGFAGLTLLLVAAGARRLHRRTT